MNSQADKAQENANKAVANAMPQQQAGPEFTFEFEDNRAEGITQRKLQQVANNRGQVKQLKAIQAMVNNSPRVKQLLDMQAMANRQAPQVLQQHENLEGENLNEKSAVAQRADSKTRLLAPRQPNVNPAVSVFQRAVSADTLNLWDREHNQAIALESGSDTSNHKAVELDDGNITVNISEHAANHFVNRHTIKEFSFKDENIKEVNSFWPVGQTHDSVADKAEKVVEGLEGSIKEKIQEGGGAVFSKKDSVAGITVGYNTSLDADDASYDEDAGTYSAGSGNVNMFYPEGDEYDYYKTDELKEIRTKLQRPPYNKVLQLKENGTTHVTQLHNHAHQPVVQRVTIEQARGVLEKSFNEDVFGNFTTALTKLGIDLQKIPGVLVEKLSDPMIPHFYLPSTAKIWEEFIDKILKYQATPLTAADMPRVNLAEAEPNEEFDSRRRAIINSTTRASEETNSQGLNRLQQQRYEQIKPLGEKVLRANLTSNFALDTLFKYTSPFMLNAFEIKERFNVTPQNIKGELEGERKEKEKELFGLDDAVNPVLRPRYAALNFKGHEYGAAARNDYGLCHMVFKDHVKSNATFTCGDTFDTDRVYPFSATGIDALLRTLAKTDAGLFPEHLKLLNEATYTPGDTYFDTQIHQEIDIRKDVSEILVSTVEMKLFNMDIALVDKLISNLTGGLFIRFE